MKSYICKLDKLISSFLIVLFSMFLLACDDEEYHVSQRPAEVAHVYFSETQYNMATQEELAASENQIFCMIDSVLGPGVLVKAEDSEGNIIQIQFQNQVTTGSLHGDVRYYSSGKKKWHAADTTATVTAIIRNDQEICEFYFSGPQFLLKDNQDAELKLDSLKIQTLREDD